MIFGGWEEIEMDRVPKWINIPRKSGDLYAVHYIKGRRYEYKFVGSFSGMDIDSKVYRRRRWS